ncbi:M20/M25/M40 family metallo-hydrolase [Bacillus sp. 2205SS5-2]|uniref:M20/M25/M40 family metallo-hydrolase n=1 Tax=Bacillus sp. 2205SS5-2 TaxID=3109031 RepID=UPI003005C348
MFQHLTGKLESEQVEFLTRTLVSLKSYNSTVGETDKALFIQQLIGSFPYFKEHPMEVWAQNIPADPFGRKNIFARVKGKTRKTILFHAHIDTVGTEDYGSLQDMAHHPEFLQKFFVDFDGDEGLKLEAMSGKWLFGRGALDMQSGIAVHLVNLLHFSEQKEKLNGDVLFLFNADEESQHRGVLSAIHELYEMKQNGTKFIAGLNNDFISPMYEGDTQKYIYTGAAGKVLPCFYIYGREAHVGDVLQSIDPTHIAANIISEINHNLALTEKIDGEFILPPTCLYLKETKEEYNVQTPVSAKLYFNYFVYEKAASEILNDLKWRTSFICTTYEKVAKERFEVFRQKQGFPETDLNWSVHVVTLNEFIEELTSKGVDVDAVMEVAYRLNHEQGKDERELAFQLVEALQQCDPDRSPRVILFYAPPYLPHNYLDKDNEFGSKVKKVLEDTLEQLSDHYDEKFVLKRFFPYLADGSFLSIPGSEKDIQAFKKNMPMMDVLYPLPTQKIKELNIPSINLGVYGKDGHKWTERVYKPYTFEVLPKLIRTVAMELLKIKCEGVE